ncbi:ROK family protein [Cohnella cholangitidis]|uniref:ROK family protein n=2 Tax=Cohnella cholangitidis TaxID=2598458 RepID=A0A7G5C6I3_9BACL|nr:ROK family protein [Cohnella cholangitidis]QMV44817.1 ROK family protein [Cohnella cholangitidis]
MKKAIFRRIRVALLESGSATKVELSRKLDISFPTISKFITEMEKDGELISVGLDDSSGGRRANRYRYNPEHTLGLAIFLEKTETNYIVFNCVGEVKEQGQTLSVLMDDIQSLTKRVEEIVRKYPQIGSMAIGVPGSVNKGKIIYIPNYEHFYDFDLKGLFEERFSIPVVVENDMNAAVIGYYHKRNNIHSSLIYLYFGQNGPGAGIMINGDVVRGSTFFSGEVSFVPLYNDRNFLQALTREGEQGTGKPITEEKIDAISRLVVTFTAILNPGTVIFCRDEVNDSITARIASRCAAYIPEEHLPKLTESDWKQDYLYGLQTLGLSLMIKGTRI